MQRVRPPRDGGVALGATCNARGARGRTWSRCRGGTAEGNHLTPSVFPGKDDSDGINGSSSSSSDDSCASSDGSNNNDSGDLPALVRRPARDLKVFGELPALQNGCTRSQLRGLTTSASCADVLLSYAMRTVEANWRRRPRKSNELTINCWKSAWRRHVSGSRRSRGVMRCWSSARRSRTPTVLSQWQSNNNPS